MTWALRRRTHGLAAGALLGVAGLLACACGPGSNPAATPTVGYCASASSVRDAYGVIAAINPSTTFAQVKTAYDVATGRVDAADSTAPEDIRRDWDTVRNLADSGNAALQAALDLNSAEQATQRILAGTSGLDAATGRVVAYTQTHCGFSLSASSPAK